MLHSSLGVLPEKAFASCSVRNREGLYVCISSSFADEGMQATTAASWGGAEKNLARIGEISRSLALIMHATAAWITPRQRVVSVSSTPPENACYGKITHQQQQCSSKLRAVHFLVAFGRRQPGCSLERLHEKYRLISGLLVTGWSRMLMFDCRSILFLSVGAKQSPKNHRTLYYFLRFCETPRCAAACVRTRGSRARLVVQCGGAA